MIDYLNEAVSRVAVSEDLFQIKKLWKDSFSDTDSFINWNFKYNYKENNTFVQDIKGEVASVAQIISHNLVFSNVKLSAAYIWGVLTRKKFRGGGLVRKNFEYLLPQAFLRGYNISVLASEVDGMYEKFGYFTICSSESYKPPKTYNVAILDERDIVIAYLDNMYKGFISDKKLYTERTYEYWGKIIDEIEEGSKGVVALTDNGYALLYPSKDGYVAEELIGKNKTDATEAMPVMIRVINAEALGKKLAKHISEDMVLTICDDYIRENNITIAFENGRARVCDGKGKLIGIGEFGAMFFDSCGRNDDVYINFPL